MQWNPGTKAKDMDQRHNSDEYDELARIMITCGKQM